MAMALFWVKLDAVNVPALHRAAQRGAVVDSGSNVRRRVADDLVTVIEIETLSLKRVAEQRARPRR